VRRAASLAAALAAALSGCADVKLRRDERLRILAPPERTVVHGPVVVEWRIDADDFRPAGFDGSAVDGRGVFAVFVDRPPIAPGRYLDSLAESDRLCRATPGCPDREWLADRGVLLTTQPRVALAALPAGRGRRAGSGQRAHEITIVLLDGRGRRIGESAWSRTLYAPERSGR
jgi:hypothetical protein